MCKVSKGNYIAGQWMQGGEGHEFKSLSPSDNDIIWKGRYATANEINAAVLAARDAFNVWSKLELEQRSAYLHAFVEVLKTNKTTLATCISSEIGKPQWEASTEVDGMIGKLEPTEDAYNERSKDTSRQLAIGISRTHFRPHGVVLVLGPYNFPGHMANGHIMPALLAGNTIIYKPSEHAPAVAEQIMEYWIEAGLPTGVINLLQGDGSVGQQICQHHDINGIFFTGSRHVGESIRNLASVDKNLALEMGGNNPLIVWDASDIDAAVLATIQSAFITSGQRCSAARRLIVPSNNFGQSFLDRLVRCTSRIHVGKPDETPQPYMGPVRLSSLVERLLNEQENLISHGAIPLLKCKQLALGDSFISPGILDVTSVSPRKDKEIFGPLIQVIQVDDFDSALNEANNTEFGLAAGIITEDVKLYERFQDIVRAGIINWNQQLTGASGWAPFGGIKHSGNFRPSAYLAADYCVYSTASIELEKVTLPNELPPGISFD